jgi:hypothetical protein
VRPVLAALAAEFLHLQPLCGRLLVLGARIIPILALRTLKRNDFPHF